jgi:membrane protease YdiL (CAAX protease family)
MFQNPDLPLAPPESLAIRPPGTTDEDPPWSGWDVISIVLVTIGTLMISLLLVTAVTRRMAFAHTPFMQVMSFPLVVFGAQMLAYVLTLGFMFTTATRNTSAGFATAVRWNWPHAWGLYVLLGVAFCIALQFLANALPMPHKSEMDIFFQTPLRAWILSICGMSLVPLFEEMLFRGFLYPVLARRLGLILAVIFTAVPFVMIHVPQLEDPKMAFAKSWGAILVISIIGFALTIVRAVKKSVAAGVLMHMAYNGFTSILAIYATGGFRHLERITR